MKDRPALLLVDDLPENLFALEEMLRRQDVDIFTARSGREALEILLERSIALAIIDVQMPEMDGFELASLIRSVQRTRHLPIIFVTAGSRDEYREFRGYEAGAVDFLFKPIDVHVLRSKVDVFITLETQRKALEASENRFRRLFELGMIGVVFVDRSGEVADANDAFLSMTGFSRADFETRGFEASGLAAVLAAELRESRESGRFGPVQRELVHASGRQLPVLLGGAPMDPEGGMLSFVLDMTEQKESERIRETFIAILGHDLRNPLSSVILGTQLALKRTEDESIQNPLRRVLEGADRMMRMIDQLLDLKRLRFSTKLLLRPSSFDLRELLRQALRGAPIDGASVHFEVEGDTRGSWDEDRLFQVVTNLIGNACEHGAKDAPVRVRLDGRHEAHVTLEVHNRGPAIPEAARPLMFEPFRSLPSGRGAKKGLGLGLFITKKFVEAHGGAIDVRSSEEEGTTFRVVLPRERTQSRRSAGAARPFS